MSESNGDLSGKDPKTGQFVEGNTYAKGRKLGSKNWHTVFDQALLKIAESQNKTPEEIERALQEIGIVKALKGDHRFWSELQKRQYGDIEKRVHLTADEEPSEKVKELAEALNED